MRAQVEVALLTNGIPFSAIDSAPDDRVIRWYAVLVETSETEGDRIKGLIEQQ